eukprot:CAMPEP_0206015132 /NCGR_PEP_ID=MMETSP1464-20131121/19506_1 /ASSEMBLY_ACC=CAM_ASM_001124 /TAXON_ID=119497 /ORGANISM="Exanthemachrysis gayraliae, Strain RCC1523" /LENGTH=122 /DNA_ID=CAMNT_0053388911 /DNA_START=108 /DNA_END=474 /DNA_ORIENTATION=-
MTGGGEPGAHAPGSDGCGPSTRPPRPCLAGGLCTAIQGEGTTATFCLWDGRRGALASARACSILLGRSHKPHGIPSCPGWVWPDEKCHARQVMAVQGERNVTTISSSCPRERPKLTSRRIAL